MEKFSTFDVARILQIDRTRLQEWIDKGFITPHKRASGKGTKSIFSRNDLYVTALFRQLLFLGFSRDNSAKFHSKINFQNVGPADDQIKYLHSEAFLLKGINNLDHTYSSQLRVKLNLNKHDASLMMLTIDLLYIKNAVDDLIKDDDSRTAS